VVIEWSVPLQIWFQSANSGNFDYGIGVFNILNGLFCAAAVMISFGAVLGKVTPLQLGVMGIIEPVFYWLNFYIGSVVLQALDIGGGMFIHTFGCYFGLACTRFVTTKHTKNHRDNGSNYNSDLFSLAGTLFLWMMWPSFNAATAARSLPYLRAIVNTFISLNSATVATFVVSRICNRQKLDVVHIQNSTLAGGVVMGVAANLDVTPGGAMLSGAAAGAVSVIGFHFITPFLNNKFSVQDTCGINNLHGIPGIMGAIVGIFTTLARRNSADEVILPRGHLQPGFQTAALFISIGLGIGGGAICGMIMKALTNVYQILPQDYYNDRPFWGLPVEEIYEKGKLLTDKSLPKQNNISQ